MKMTAHPEVERTKTRKGARVVKARQPQLIENVKKAMFIRAANCNQSTTDILKDLYILKKPDGVMMQRKNELIPFDDAMPVEKMLAAKDVSLFVVGSHNKKRPQNIVFGRTFDRETLDMFELGAQEFRSLSDFKVPKVSAMVKPILIFSGESWTQSAEMTRLKNFFIDFFRGEVREYVAVNGLEHVIAFTALDTTHIMFRSYRTVMKKSGERVPRVELEEIGPHIDFVLRRSRLASAEKFKVASKQPKELKAKKKKNQEKDDLGSSLGRVHMERQNFGDLQTRKMKGLKKKGALKEDDQDEADVADEMEE